VRILLTLLVAAAIAPAKPVIVWKPIPFDAHRRAEMAQYATRHYGLLTWRLEHPQVIAERLERAVRAVGDRERVMAGTDCGFGTIVGDTQVSEDVVWAKLEAMRDGAAIASRRLWG